MMGKVNMGYTETYCHEKKKLINQRPNLNPIKTLVVFPNPNPIKTLVVFPNPNPIKTLVVFPNPDPIKMFGS